MHNWFELEKYMLSREAELLQCAKAVRVPRAAEERDQPPIIRLSFRTVAQLRMVTESPRARSTALTTLLSMTPRGHQR